MSLQIELICWRMDESSDIVSLLENGRVFRYSEFVRGWMSLQIESL